MDGDQDVKQGVGSARGVQEGSGPRKGPRRDQEGSGPQRVGSKKAPALLPVLYGYLLLPKVRLMETNPWSLKKFCNKQSLWRKVVVTCRQSSTWAGPPVLTAAWTSPAERVTRGCLFWTCWDGLENSIDLLSNTGGFWPTSRWLSLR